MSSPVKVIEIARLASLPPRETPRSTWTMRELRERLARLNAQIAGAAPDSDA